METTTQGFINTKSILNLAEAGVLSTKTLSCNQTVRVDFPTGQPIQQEPNPSAVHSTDQA